MMQLAHAIEASALSAFMKSQFWVWPTLEIFHLIGFALLFGGLLIFDLRILGFAQAIPLGGARQFLRFAIIGFLMNIVTGSLLVVGDPHHFLISSAMHFKLALIGAAGLNALYFTLAIQPRLLVEQQVNLTAKYSATLSLLLWAGVGMTARFIAFVE